MAKKEFLTAEKLLEKKELILKSQESEVFESDFLDAKILIDRLPVEEVYEIMLDESKSYYKKECELVYMSCKCFRDEELAKSYETKVPYDIIEIIFGGNASELQRLVNKIVSMYGILDLANEIKK